MKRSESSDISGEDLESKLPFCTHCSEFHIGVYQASNSVVIFELFFLMKTHKRHLLLPIKYVQMVFISCYIYGCHSRANGYLLLGWLPFLLTDPQFDSCSTVIYFQLGIQNHPLKTQVRSCLCSVFQWFLIALRMKSNFLIMANGPIIIKHTTSLVSPSPLTPGYAPGSMSYCLYPERFTTGPLQGFSFVWSSVPRYLHCNSLLC